MLKKDKQVGEYILTEKLGTGGFGEVWKAEKRTVLSTSLFAIKFFRAKDEDQIDTETVRKEVETWQRLSGLPHVISVIEGNTFEDYVYIVSEFADGGSLEKWLNANGGKANSYNEAVAITSQLLKGLESMHSEGFVHRDLKPANVLLKRNILYLADFGISRQMKTHSKSTSTAGTYEYMPPEAFDGKPLVSVHTDIWATGVILQKLLTGKLPFPQEEIPSLMAAIIMREPEPIDKSVPASLRVIVRKALQKKPEDRFQSAREMLEALHNPQAFLEGQTIQQTVRSSNVEKTTEFEVKPADARRSFETKEKLSSTSEQTIYFPNAQPTEQSRKSETINTPETIVAAQQVLSNNSVSAHRSKNYLMFIIPAVLVGVLLIGLVGLAIWKVIGSTSKSLVSNSNQVANNDANRKVDKTLSDVDYYNQANECLKKKDYDCAIKNFTEAINITSNYSEAYQGRGTAYRDRGDYVLDEYSFSEAEPYYQRAIDDFGKAIDLKPDYTEAYNGRCDTYTKRNLVGENKEYFKLALQDCNRAIKLKADNPEAYTGLGNAYRSNGEFDTAIMEYKLATETNPYFIRAYIESADTYGRKFKYAQGIAEINKAIDLDPTDSENYRLRGYFNEMLNKKTQAISDYRKALEVNPNDKHAKLSLETILDK